MAKKMKKKADSQSKSDNSSVSKKISSSKKKGGLSEPSTIQKKHKKQKASNSIKEASINTNKRSFSGVASKSVSLKKKILHYVSSVFGGLLIATLCGYLIGQFYVTSSFVLRIGMLLMGMTLGYIFGALLTFIGFARVTRIKGYYRFMFLGLFLSMVFIFIASVFLRFNRVPELLLATIIISVPLGLCGFYYGTNRV
jgi:F0F1-type ATP synthase assembly protein I